MRRAGGGDTRLLSTEAPPNDPITWMLRDASRESYWNFCRSVVPTQAGLGTATTNITIIRAGVFRRSGSVVSQEGRDTRVLCVL